MDFSATIDLIIKDLKDASDIIDDLKKYPGVPALQVELAKSKCKSAGEVIALLKTLKDPSSYDEKEPVIQKQVLKQPARGEQKTLEIVAPEVEEKIPEAAPREKKLPPVMKEPQPKKTDKKEEESPSVADKFSPVSNSFNEQLGAVKGDDDIAGILKTKPITSLVQAIDLNDKFLFISEIFRGNKTDYAHAISRLESTDNLTDAKAILMSYTGGNEESEAVRVLLELVKRKLPSDE
jgi:hypothetical protein